MPCPGVLRRLATRQRADPGVEVGRSALIRFRQFRLREGRLPLLHECVLPRRSRAGRAERLAGVDLIEPPVADGVPVVVDDDLIALAAEGGEFRVLGGLHDERAVGRHDEPRPGEPPRQLADQFPPPFRMEMQVDLVHEDDGRPRERVGADRVALDHPAGEIDHPGDERLVAVAQRAERHPAVGCVELDARPRVDALRQAPARPIPAAECQMLYRPLVIRGNVEKQ